VRLLIGVDENENFYWLVPDGMKEKEAIRIVKEGFTDDPGIEFYTDEVFPVFGYTVVLKPCGT